MRTDNSHHIAKAARNRAEQTRRRAVIAVRHLTRRMSQVPWNFGGGPMGVRRRSRSHHDGWH